MLSGVLKMFSVGTHTKIRHDTWCYGVLHGVTGRLLHGVTGLYSVLHLHLQLHLKCTYGQMFF